MTLYRDIRSHSPDRFSLSAADNKEKDPDEIGNRDVGKGVNFYSLDKEIALGKQLAQEVERQSKIIDDPMIAEYVNRLGQNLVRNSDAKVPFTIKVIETEEVNAFALPGGFFFVNSGLILKADKEAELAGVMAHEIAHVAARHGTRQATRGQIAQLATIPLIFMGGWTGYAIRQAASVAIPMGFLSSRARSKPKRTCSGCNTCTRPATIRCFRRFLREDSSSGKEETGNHGQGVFHASDDGRPDPGGPEEYPEVSQGAPEYVVTTSEFNDVKERLASLHNKRKIDNQDLNRPTLRKAPGAGTSGGSNSVDKPATTIGPR